MFQFIRTLIRPLTFPQLVAAYLASPDYLALSASSKAPYRRVVQHLATRLEARPVRAISRGELEAALQDRSPGAFGDDLKKLRILFRFACDRGYRQDDPTRGIRRYPAGLGHHTWTEAELAQFEAHWPLGTRERLAFALLLYTGQRRSDVVRMRWEDIAEGRLTVRQRKTGAVLLIPLHPRLQAALVPGAGPLLRTAQGCAFTPAGFGLWMAARIAAAGLPERCVTHGLRKAAARRLAEAGCSAKEIASITGHATLAEVSRYTAAADQRRLAEQALGRIGAGPAMQIGLEGGASMTKEV